MVKRALVVILGIGFGYRLLFIGKIQLRTDELMQALVVRADSAAALLDRLRGGTILGTPLDPLIQRVGVTLLGESAWGLRLHAAILGALAIWMCYRATQFLFGEKVALYTALLFALYPLHHHFSQEGLPWALTTFLTLCSFDLLFRLWLGAYCGWRWWLAWTGIEVLLLFSSSAGIAVLLSQCGAAVLSHVWKGRAHNAGNAVERGAAKSAAPNGEAKTAVAFAACAVLAFALFWPWTHFAWAGHSIARPEGLNPHLMLRIVKELGDGSYPVTGLLLVGVAAGTFAMLRHSRSRELPWLAAWFVIPPGVIFLMDRWAGDSLSIGQILACTPPLFMIAGYGMSRVGERLTFLDQPPVRIGTPALVYAAVFAIASIVIAQNHWRRTPTDWQGVAQYLGETLRSGDILVIPAGSQLLEFYDPRLADFRSYESLSVIVSKEADSTGRRFAVCLNSMSPDPCAAAREATTKDKGLRTRRFEGLTVFSRE